MFVSNGFTSLLLIAIIEKYDRYLFTFLWLASLRSKYNKKSHIIVKTSGTFPYYPEKMDYRII